MVRYVDSHIHLSDAEYADELDHLLLQFEHLDIHACAVSMDYADSVRTLEIARKSPQHVLPFVGIHPECVDESTIDDTLYRMALLAEQNNIAGIGEIGLDPTFADDCRIPASQMRVFEGMLELAARLDKPVSIHSRKSLDDILDVMTSYDAGRASLHWFDGGKRQLAQAQDMGFYISYGPVSVYANDKQSLIARSNLDKILVETDGPVRFSRCFEYKPGQSCFVASVLYVISQVHRMPFDSVSEIVANNSAAYLGMK